ncbi:MAG: hypothetical protein HFE29_02975 [Clostridia bacterium]|jgi:hypothetical protein|nr:hypothetical protein [Clostridia bacterium]
MLKGKDTYATIGFADQYIATHYPQNHPLSVHFSVLTDDEKGVYLNLALQEIEALPFVGRKYIISQPLQFPRIRGGSFNRMTPTYASAFAGSGGANEIPLCIMQAQVENALGVLASEISAVSDRQFMTLQSLGIIKNTKYNKREAGDLGFGADITGATSRRCPLSSGKAYALLREWLGGAYVC